MKLLNVDTLEEARRKVIRAMEGSPLRVEEKELLTAQDTCWQRTSVPGRMCPYSEDLRWTAMQSGQRIPEAQARVFPHS